MAGTRRVSVRKGGYVNGDRMSAQTVADGVREYVMAGMPPPTFEDERRVLELFQVRVGILSDGQVKVRCRIPTDGKLTYSQVRV